MKKNYTKKHKSLVLFTFLLIGLASYAQDVHFTFANAKNTNSEGNNYFEVDVMMQAINSTESFKLGSGQLYFTYNTAAFGENINANSSFEVTYEDDYICGQGIDLASSIKIYGGFTTNDNTASRVSWAFSQTFSSSTFAEENVSEISTKLCHVKIKYTDVSEDAMFMFESGNSYTGQFFTACGLEDGGAAATADCTAEPGIQLVNDSFENGGSTLSTKNLESFPSLSLYPNPMHDLLRISLEVGVFEKIIIYDSNGKVVFHKDTNLPELLINVDHFSQGIYLLKIISSEGISRRKILKD